MSLPEGAPARSNRGAESGSLSGHPSTQPENAAAPAQYPSAERRYRPNVTSGCPKRSEGGCPCRNEDDNRLSKRSQTERRIPSEIRENERGAASHLGRQRLFR